MGNNIRNSVLLLLLFIVFLSNTLSISLAKPCHPVDEEALLDVKRRITTNQAPAFSTWSNTKECCTAWHGVVCDPNHGRVVKLSWYLDKSNDLLSIKYDNDNDDDDDNDHEPVVSGTLSPFLANLTYLKKLDFSNFMNLTGPIPPELSKLSNLVNLNLRNNQLSGSIPSSLSQLSKLKYLDLSNNNLSGIIPPSISNLLSLEYLFLDDNKFTGDLPMLPLSIVYLDLSSNEITGKLPSWIGNMRELIKLDLSKNGFNSTIPEELGNLKSLRIFSVLSNNLYGSIPGKLLELKFLQVFDVSKNRLTGKIPPHEADLSVFGFMGNPGLCDAPLPPCTKFVN